MNIIKHRKIFYTISMIIILVSIVSLFVWGLKPGVDFSGGSSVSVTFEGQLPSVDFVKQSLSNVGIEDATVRLGEGGYMIRSREINQNERNKFISELSYGGAYKPIEKNFSSVGPILGKEAIQKSWISIVLVLVAIILFIAFAFRKVSKPTRPGDSVGRVSSWVYGVVAILALLHDVIVPMGVFAILGHFLGFEVDTLFVTAILVILGFSVHDTIVVFDRVRENLHLNEEKRLGKSFDQVVGESISQTLIRSLNTSLTTLLAIIALYVWGPETVRHFSLTLLIGIAVGTYSSIFIGSPLLVTINNFKK